MVRTALLTVSEGEAGSQGEDLTAQAVREVLATGPFVEVDYQVVPDEQAMIRARLRIWADGSDVDLILTTGGIGVSLRARTPEATSEVVERSLPGLAEAVRWALAGNPRAAYLTRGVAGFRRSTVIINLPKGPEEARTALSAIRDVLPEAVEALR